VGLDRQQQQIGLLRIKGHLRAPRPISTGQAAFETTFRQPQSNLGSLRRMRWGYKVECHGWQMIVESQEIATIELLVSQSTIHSVMTTRQTEIIEQTATATRAEVQSDTLRLPFTTDDIADRK
jgi:hypothetical protein